MKILIRSRSAIEKMTLLPFEKGTALISITDWDCDFAELKNNPDYLLQVKFDDEDSDIFEYKLKRKPNECERIRLENIYHMLNDEQANQIADFYHSIASKTKILICQCEHGQSRSVAIAAAIMEYRSKRGIDVFANDNYYPNKYVFRKVLKALNRK